MRHSRHLATGLGRPEVVSRVKWILGFGSSADADRLFRDGDGAELSPQESRYPGARGRRSDYSGAFPQHVWEPRVPTEKKGFRLFRPSRN